MARARGNRAGAPGLPLPAPEALRTADRAVAPGETRAQLARYLADERLRRQFPAVRFTGLTTVLQRRPGMKERDLLARPPLRFRESHRS